MPRFCIHQGSFLRVLSRIIRILLRYSNVFNNQNTRSSLEAQFYSSLFQIWPRELLQYEINTCIFIYSTNINLDLPSELQVIKRCNPSPTKPLKLSWSDHRFRCINSIPFTKFSTSCRINQPAIRMKYSLYGQWLKHGVRNGPISRACVVPWPWWVCGVR